MSEENEKPDWFQMTEGDEIPRQRNIKRGVRVLAVTLPLLVLGTGFVVAQSHGGPGASANASVSSASSQGTSAQTLSSTENSPAPVTTTPSATPSATPFATPSIIAPPTGGDGEQGSEGSSAITPNVGSGSISQLPTTRGEGHDKGEHHRSRGTVPTIGSGTAPAIGTAPSITLPTGGGEGNDN